MFIFGLAGEGGGFSTGGMAVYIERFPPVDQVLLFNEVSINLVPIPTDFNYYLRTVCSTSLGTS